MADRMRLMAVHAHPDDESSKGAATLARYVDEGHDVLVVSCTGGERGDVLNPTLQEDPAILRELPEVRRREMAEAARILGVEHHWLGFVDSGLPEGDPTPALPDGCFALEPQEITVEALVREIRRFRPHVITTYDENGGYPHPDHIMCHVVSVAAFRAAGDPEQYPHAGEAWQPLKLYYDRAFSRAKVMTLHQAIIDAGEESPYADWIERWDHIGDARTTTQVYVADYFAQREGALKAHATQVDPNGNFFRVSRETQAKVWPTEEFDLAASYVPRPDDAMEDDLFAGLGTPVDADALATNRDAELVIDDIRERETAS